MQSDIHSASIHPASQAGLKESVLKNDLCTGCGACVHLCPYFEYYRDGPVILHPCDGADGRCRAYCPRTPADMTALRERLFDAADLTPEIGAVRGLYITRAADRKVRASAQHGGTVSVLAALALAEGVVDTMVLAESTDKLLSESVAVSDEAGVMRRRKSKFVVSPTVAKFNETARGPAARVGVVATPCQALALAKMRCFPAEGDAPVNAKLALVIGLFCGWAFSWEKLKPILDLEFKSLSIRKMDILPSRHQCMEVSTETMVHGMPLSMVEEAVRKNCRYCFDMTAEFSDISVGSARSSDGWDVDKRWNQVLVRTALGERLLESARAKGLLEFKAVPEGNLQKLKMASANKKKNCLRHLAEKSGRPDDFIYLDREDPVVRRMQSDVINQK